LDVIRDGTAYFAIAAASTHCGSSFCDDEVCILCDHRCCAHGEVGRRARLSIILASARGGCQFSTVFSSWVDQCLPQTHRRVTAVSPNRALCPPAGHVETMSHLERKGQKHSRSPPAVSGGCYHRRLRSYDCEALLGTRWPETQLRKLRMCSSADPPARAPVVVIVDSICDAQGRTRMYDAAADISDII
jgi:hypothetical protein